MGYAPDSWDALGRSLSGSFPEALLVEAGLQQPRAEGKGAYDRFRNRLLFVLRDDRGPADRIRRPGPRRRVRSPST